MGSTVDLDLSIVCVSWNTASLLSDCLRSVPAAAAGLNYELIVVDNASTDGSPQRVAAEFPDTILLCNDENAGFARANNRGIRHSLGRYVLLLNSDTVVPTGALAALVHFMDDHPATGAVGPRLLRADGMPQAFAYGKDPRLGYLMRRAFVQLVLRRSVHDWDTKVVQEVDWVSGACLMARRAAIDQVGLLDENIFMYFEDADWCLRFRRKGWHVHYNPEVEIVHLGGQSLKQQPRAQYVYRRSLKYFYAKHYHPLAQLLLQGLLKLYGTMR